MPQWTISWNVRRNLSENDESTEEMNFIFYFVLISLLPNSLNSPSTVFPWFSFDNHTYGDGKFEILVCLICFDNFELLNQLFDDRMKMEKISQPNIDLPQLKTLWSYLTWKRNGFNNWNIHTDTSKKMLAWLMQLIITSIQ